MNEQIDEILAQAFTDGASDTMWQNDRHVEIFATAKSKLQRLIVEARIEENKRWLTILAPSMDENVAYNSDFHDRIGELTKELEKHE